MRFDPTENCDKDHLNVTDLPGADLVELQFGDFVVKVHKPIPIAGKVAKHPSFSFFQDASVEQTSCDIFVLGNGAPETLRKDVTTEVQQCL